MAATPLCPFPPSPPVGEQVMNFPLNGGHGKVHMPWAESAVMKPLSSFLQNLSM